MRYIDTDALLSRLPDDLPYKASVKRVLMQAPTADVVEVRHGHNKLFDYPTLFECSICGASDDDTLTGNGEYKYCPWCGAKMDGETCDIDAFIEQIESCSFTVIKDTADVVEVVRCKDCVLRNTPDCAMRYECSKCGGQWSWENNYDYCSFGERREENEG
jgi:hypothetical protein